MKQFILKNRKALTGITALLLLGGILMSFQDSPFVRQQFDLQQASDDTVPEKNFDDHMKMKDFDKLANQLDGTMLQVGDALKQIDLDKIQKDVENSLKNVDIDNIMKTVDLSLKNIDLDKILADVRNSLKDLDLDKNSDEINKAMQEAKQEVEKARDEIKNIDRKEIDKELENAKLEIEKTKSEIRKIDIDKIMKEARAGVDQGKEELRQIRSMFNEMERDGLINQKDGFSIEYKDKDLYINGKKQAENITDKYRKYFKEDHFKITIDKE
jgi:hypothetical protein